VAAIALRTASLASRRWRNYLVYVHGCASPTDEEWTRVLAHYGEAVALHPRILILTMGGAPNAAQRARLSEAHGKSRPPMAVLTRSVVSRAAGTAYSWFNPRLKMFAPDQLDDALVHLGATDEEAVELRALVGELGVELGVELGEALVEALGKQPPAAGPGRRGARATPVDSGASHRPRARRA
jgi:hypothetical protein